MTLMTNVFLGGRSGRVLSQIDNFCCPCTEDYFVENESLQLYIIISIVMCVTELLS